MGKNKYICYWIKGRGTATELKIILKQSKSLFTHGHSCFVKVDILLLLLI